MSARIALLVIDDRGWVPAAVASFTEHARGVDVWHTALVDDRSHTLGFCGAIREGWGQLREVLRSNPSAFDYVFHLESDFRFLRDFDISAMTRALDADPLLAQVALRRGPHGPVEIEAGGFVNLWPAAYEDCEINGTPFLRHALNFTTNPSIYRRELTEREWPTAPGCEETFGQALIREGYRFAFWGARSDDPWIEHVGLTRLGVGY